MFDTKATNTLAGLWPPLWIALAATAAIVGIDFLTKAPDLKFTREHGGVELASALLYLWAAAIWTVLHGPRELRRKWQIPTVLLMMGGREFDLDKSLTSVGLLKSNLYLTAQAPVWERLLGVAVLALTVTVLVRLARQQGRGFLNGLRRGAVTEVAVLAGLLLAVFAKTIDGIGRKLAGTGIELSAATGARFGSIEEALELFVPILFLIATLLAVRRRRRTSEGKLERSDCACK